jgi:hypothetical protein
MPFAFPKVPPERALFFLLWLSFRDRVGINLSPVPRKRRAPAPCPCWTGVNGSSRPWVRDEEKGQAACTLGTPRTGRWYSRARHTEPSARVTRRSARALDGWLDAVRTASRDGGGTDREPPPSAGREAEPRRGARSPRNFSATRGHPPPER